MNLYSLSSTSRRWWWPSAAAGAVALAAICTMFVSAGSAAESPRASGAAGQPANVHRSQCLIDSRHLLARSPDAVTGWYRSCLEHGPRPTQVRRSDPNFLPWPDKPIPEVILVPPRPTQVLRSDPNFLPWPDKPIPEVTLVR